MPPIAFRLQLVTDRSLVRGESLSAAIQAAAELRAQGDINLLARAVAAARHDATLGEISAAMEAAFGRFDTVPMPVFPPSNFANGIFPPGRYWRWRKRSAP